jgi:hypothetical protein
MDKFFWRIHTVESVLLWREFPGGPSYTDVVLKFFNAFDIGAVIAATVLALIYRREVPHKCPRDSLFPWHLSSIGSPPPLADDLPVLS